jgi:hypothetical protein
MDRRRVIMFHTLFALAMVSVVLGAGLLVTTTGKVRGPTVLMSLMIMACGTMFSYFAVVGKRSAKAVFLGFSITSGAIVRFTGTVLGASVVDYWPVFAIAAGVSFLPAGFIHYRKSKPSFIVPSASLILLGLFLSVFSFGFSSMSFLTFITLWWPALLIVAGLVLFLVWFFQRLVYSKLDVDKPDDGAEV